MLINNINNVFKNRIDSKKEIISSSKIIEKNEEDNFSSNKEPPKVLGCVLPNKDVLKPFNVIGRKEENFNKFVPLMKENPTSTTKRKKNP
jgi:hypothetical protein